MPTRGNLPKGEESATFQAVPRLGGENVAYNVFHNLTGGSSPRMRGKQGELRAADSVRGLIPACAGKTLIDLQRGDVTSQYLFTFRSYRNLAPIKPPSYPLNGRLYSIVSFAALSSAISAGVD